MRLTSGFTQAGVYARRNSSANFQVSCPAQTAPNRHLRQAATTLAVSLSDNIERKWNDLEKNIKNIKFSDN